MYRPSCVSQSKTYEQVVDVEDREGKQRHAGQWDPESNQALRLLAVQPEPDRLAGHPPVHHRRHDRPGELTVDQAPYPDPGGRQCDRDHSLDGGAEELRPDPLAEVEVAAQPGGGNYTQGGDGQADGQYPNQRCQPRLVQQLGAKWCGDGECNAEPDAEDHRQGQSCGRQPIPVAGPLHWGRPTPRSFM